MPLRLLLETAAATDCSVRIEGPEPELDQVEFVTYLLQSLQGNPLRRVRERSGGFRLDAVDRNVLGVQARVHRRDGSEELLEE
jgi:hypothetical protein